MPLKVSTFWLFITLVTLSSAGVLHPTLDHTVMVGYQGWFRTPDDGAGMDWAHYRAVGSEAFAPGHLSIDYWPDLSEFDPDEKFATAFRHADGSVARVFSSYRPKTVDRHFRWMANYNIDGAFVQRFAAPIIGSSKAARTRLAAADRVLAAARDAAERHGRSFVVMYDLSGLPSGSIEQVIADWKHVVNSIGVRRSAAYQHHRGRPLIAVWGVGFADNRAYTVAETAALVDFLKHDPVYGGNSVLLGVPTWWRLQTADACDDPALPALLTQADVLSPWSPGRFYDLGGVSAHLANFWLPDREWCRARDIDYLPVVFPGFSWRNLTGRDQAIDRLDGRFLWEQYHQLSTHGFTMVYQAMFDELDEGTQIFKVTANPPPGQNLRSYAPYPPDHYLWLVSRAARSIHAGSVLSDRIPLRFGFWRLYRPLHRRDPATTAALKESAATLNALFKLGLELSAAGEAWIDAGDDRRLRTTGLWFGPRLSSTDPVASVCWELPLSSGSNLVLEGRFSGDPNHDHAAAARLRLFQGDRLLLEQTVDTRVDTLRWRRLASFSTSDRTPLTAILDAPASGVLTLFDARVRADAPPTP